MKDDHDFFEDAKEEVLRIMQSNKEFSIVLKPAFDAKHKEMHFYTSIISGAPKYEKEELNITRHKLREYPTMSVFDQISG